MVGDLVGLVFVVEDDDSMREAMGRLLEAAGFRCATFRSAEAVLAGATGEGIACVISDQKLPEMSGLELLAALRERHCSLPFILITAHDTPGLRDDAERCRATAYLAKPFRGTALLEVLKAAIEPVSPS